jgi:streptogramin lyase
MMLTVAVILGMGVVGTLSAADGDVDSLLVEYPVPGNPHHLVVESPGHVWFTLPEQNMVGQLIVTSTVDYQVFTYTTTITEPYDIDYAADVVWFTGRAGNQIGRLDPETGIITAFPIPTADSQPTGLDVVAGTPTQVWFTEFGGNKLGELLVTSTMEYSWHEYPLPDAYPNAALQDIAVGRLDHIWFTAPGVNCLGNFQPSLWIDPFDFQLVKDGAPWAVEVSTTGNETIFFTDPANNQVVRYYPQTMHQFLSYPLPFNDSGPYDLAIFGGKVWFTERQGQRVGRLDPVTNHIREFSVGHGELLGIDVDADGGVWLAEYTAGKIAVWQPPYFHFLYLPLVLRGG